MKGAHAYVEQPTINIEIVFVFYHNSSCAKMSSANNSPNKRYSSPIDTFYDPEFTTQISNKMRVPERIQVVENGFDDPAIIAAKKQTNSSGNQMWMHVPERILVAGKSNSFIQTINSTLIFFR